MELPVFLACIALASSAAAGHPASSTSDYNRGSEQMDLIQITPALVFIGKRNGDILTCPYDAPHDCEIYYRLDDRVKFIHVYGEYIYAALDSTQKMMRCELHKKDSCVLFNQFDSVICSMDIENGHILAGLSNGEVHRCSLQPNNCYVLFTLSQSIYSVIEFNKSIFIASGKTIWRSSNSIGYSSVADLPILGAIMELEVVNNNLFALTSNDKLWKCDFLRNLTANCKHAVLPGGYPRTMASFNGSLYIADFNTSRPIKRCKWEAALKCTDYLTHDGAELVAFTYAMQHMKTSFKNEQKSCSWQGSNCPPYVSYYEADVRSAFEVRVSNGKLYDSRGFQVDTTDADVGSNGPSAIFVMAPEGRLYLSKTHARRLLHTSSLLASQAVSGAGEMVVKDGVIQHINTCSQHYQPKLSLNAQVIESLFYQGYTAPIESKKCHE